MGIANLDKVKSVLGIADIEEDKISLVSTLIPFVEEDYLFIRNKPFDVDEDKNIIYPIGSELTAIKMIAHLMASLESNNLGGNVKSESISRYSISYNTSGATGLGGYPKEISGMIKRYTEFF